MIAVSRYCVPALSVHPGTPDHAVDNNANRGSANTGQFESNLPIVALGFRAAIQTHGRRNSKTTAVVPICVAVQWPDSSIVNEKKHRAQSERSVLAKKAAARGLDGAAPATLIRTLKAPPHSGYRSNAFARTLQVAEIPGAERASGAGR